MENQKMSVNKEKVERKIVKATSDMQVPNFTIEKTEEYKSVAQFMSLVRSGSVKFNDPIQRNANAWDIETKSDLIISLLEEVSIGEITVQVIRENRYVYRNVLDGKQRLTTIRDFVKGKFALKTSHYVNGYDNEGNLIWIDVNDMCFDDLPKFYQDRIMATMIKFDLYDIDDEMKFELFRRRNNGVALKPAQIRKSKMSYELLYFLAEMKQLTVFTAGFTPTALNNDLHADVILKAMVVLVTDNNTALDNKTLNKMLDENVFVSGILDETKEIAQYLMKVHPLLDEKTASKSYGQSKTVSLFYIARLAKREGRSYKDFASWMKQFFVKDYAKSGFGSTSGTAKLESVKRRNDIIMKHYQKYFQAFAQ